MQNTLQFYDEILAQKNMETGIPRLSTEGVKNKIGHVTHQSNGNLILMHKICTFGGQKGKNRPPEPKNET
jgi:hypothetical protein